MQKHILSNLKATGVSPRSLINPMLVVLIAVVLRLVPHIPNFAPIGAMALFGGAYLDKRYALLMPLVAMFISDLFLGFHQTMPYVYVSFLITGFIGLTLRNRTNNTRLFFSSLGASLIFFVITNFGVWAEGRLYPQTLEGLARCYLLALPFFRNTLLGDLFYVMVFFGIYKSALALASKAQKSPILPNV